ncbi:MAG: hypothetical protein HW386_1111 [Gammaproteobacteria bacterium]|nr:hypothetical protein [Gammaproteobacteria bacterium]
MRIINGYGTLSMKAFLLFFGVSSMALAHHSAALFDFSQSVPITGIVKLINVANPHVKLILTITDDKGTAKDITYEGHSRNNVYRRGWRPDMVKEGDKITINYAPTKTGEDGGYIQSFTLSDGRQF